MKVIYDSEQPPEKRLEFIGTDGTSYYGFLCYSIRLDDGFESVEIGNWGNEKKRQAILKEKNKTAG
jgi:hypothetical protein